ncbi:hypothetical protein [Enterococcus phage phiSHEF16]|uniref:Uncharacterized protein n=4 Tax=Schiekvirus TaxID=2732968 RepID=A0AAE9JV13_9CAUD|nr:hypothetical protein [Enterococcus faecium]QVW54586.1 structural protein [Enterococcus phage 113]UMO76872.1 hypothetical protein [Enterococcus phage phiSHEF16]CAI9421155.1 Hypothetical protein PORT_76 [Enterococcus phage Porthos]
MNYPTHEKVAEITVGTDKVYLFPRYMGGTVVDALTQANGSVRGKELTFLPVHTGTDRTTGIRYLNLRQATFIDYKMVGVPTTITDLYLAPEDETEEAKEAREYTIKEYFETR